MADNFEDDNAIYERITKDQAFKFFGIYQKLKGQMQEDVKKKDEWIQKGREALSEDEQKQFDTFTSPDFGDGE